jgi:hypothetical protein
LDYDLEIRKVLCSTNALRGTHAATAAIAQATAFLREALHG